MFATGIGKIRVSAVLMLTLASCNHADNETVLVTTHPNTTTTAPVQKIAHLTIHVVDLRSKRGQLIFGIFNAADGFPSTAAKAVNWQIKPASGDGLFTVDLPPGEYGASVLHDENSNGKMDTNLLGIPEEGYGTTNNPKPRRRAVTYSESVFKLTPAGAELTISIQYDFL